jgi:outer membrane protein TolC
LSAYSIAREQIDAALAAAADSGVDAEATLRALLGTVAERYRDLKGADDLRAVLQYQLDNSQGDEDYAFMRP